MVERTWSVMRRTVTSNLLTTTAASATVWAREWARRVHRFVAPAWPAPNLHRTAPRGTRKLPTITLGARVQSAAEARNTGAKPPGPRDGAGASPARSASEIFGRGAPWVRPRMAVRRLRCEG